jgi:BlaI family transcriptional regulator, penicillinase repressor
MASIRLSPREKQLMEILWQQGEASIRELHAALPARRRPAYTTIQTLVYRLEAKRAVRRVRKVGNFHIFAPAMTQEEAHRSLLDDLLALFNGQSRPVITHLIESGKLTREDIAYAEDTLRAFEKEGQA